MDNRQLETKLTPAARQMLDEIVDDYRIQVLIAAEQSASQLMGDVREISLSDIVRSVRRVERQKEIYSTRLDRILSLYTSTAMLIGCAGITIYLVQDILADRQFEQQLPLLMGLVGFALAALVYTYQKLRRSVNMPSHAHRLERNVASETLARFLTRWRDVELALRNLAAIHFGESMAKQPVSLLMKKLEEEKVLSVEDELLIRKLLDLRNKILHEGAEASPEQIEDASRRAEKLMHRLLLSV